MCAAHRVPMRKDNETQTATIKKNEQTIYLWCPFVLFINGYVIAIETVCNSQRKIIYRYTLRPDRTKRTNEGNIVWKKIKSSVESHANVISFHRFVWWTTMTLIVYQSKEICLCRSQCYRQCLFLYDSHWLRRRIHPWKVWNAHTCSNVCNQIGFILCYLLSSSNFLPLWYCTAFHRTLFEQPWVCWAFAVQCRRHNWIRLQVIASKLPNW